MNSTEIFVGVFDETWFSDIRQTDISETQRQQTKSLMQMCSNIRIMLKM